MLNSPDMAYRFGTILTASLGIAACSDPPDRGDRPATAGDLDPTFDGDGVVTTGRAGRDVGRAVLAQSVAGGERLVVAGKAPRGNATAFFMARFDHDGALDWSFGGAAGMGYVETSLGAATSDEGKSLAIMPDGDLVLAGISTDSGNGRFAAARYDANGMPDAGFGQQGAAAIDFGSGNDEGKALAVHPCAAPLAPCLVIVGKAETPDGTGDIALVQLDAAGATAATFGKVATDLGGNDDEANDVVALADGALIVVGFTGAAGHHDLIVLRYTPAGQLDTGFGVPDAGGRRPGYTVTSVGDDDRAFAVAVDPTGGVVVAGRTATAGARDGEVIVARYDALGVPDRAFGDRGDGVRVIGRPSSDDTGTAIAVDAAGRVVVAGRSTAAGGGGSAFTVTRLTATGADDPSFDPSRWDGAGSSGDDDDGAYGMALQADGGIVLTGELHGGDDDLAVLRVVP